MNIWKIVYLNCGERYEFMIDHRIYTQLKQLWNWRSCESSWVARFVTMFILGFLVCVLGFLTVFLLLHWLIWVVYRCRMIVSMQMELKPNVTVKIPNILTRQALRFWFGSCDYLLIERFYCAGGVFHTKETGFERLKPSPGSKPIKLLVPQKGAIVTFWKALLLELNK